MVAGRRAGNRLILSYYSSGDERQYVFYDFEKGPIHNSSLGFDKNRIPPMIVSYQTKRYYYNSAKGLRI